MTVYFKNPSVKYVSVLPADRERSQKYYVIAEGFQRRRFHQSHRFPRDPWTNEQDFRSD